MALIADRPGFEVGELVDGRSLPITVEATHPQALREATDWLMSLEPVRFVDVAFVHFGDADDESQYENHSTALDRKQA